MQRLALVVVFTCLAASAIAHPPSKTCSALYAKLCKGIALGPAMLGKCNRARPNVVDKIPAQCTEDFQSAVEGYEETRPKR